LAPLFDFIVGNPPHVILENNGVLAKHDVQTLYSVLSERMLIEHDRPEFLVQGKQAVRAISSSVVAALCGGEWCCR
jgi:hypothetical protein